MTKCPFCGYTPEPDVVLWGATIKSANGRYNPMLISKDRDSVIEFIKKHIARYDKTMYVMKESDREAKNGRIPCAYESK